MLLFWIGVFVVSLAVLVKSADWLIGSSEKIGLGLGLSPFIVGVTIVGVGTSFPELISSFAAAIKGVPEVVAANVIGSNIANILLIVGISAIIAKRLVVTKSLIDLDLPLLAITTIMVIAIVADKTVTFGESVLLLVTYGIYLLYTVKHQDDEPSSETMEILPSRVERREHITTIASGDEAIERPRISFADIGVLAVSIAGLTLGATYLIDSLVQLSSMLNIAAGVIAITAVAVGTSLPELLVSAKAAYQKRSEVALGNIFGSNVFNGLVVMGLPGLVTTLPVDEQTYAIGIPAMAFATFIFVISGISRRIHIWEGAMYLAAYLLFVAKLFSWF